MTVDPGGPASSIGAARPRIDAEGKVTGATRFAGDSPIGGLLHARVVQSVYAHAWIRAIDTAAALAVPGVVAVITAADLPIVGSEDMRMFEPLARDEILFAGQPVALVVAETESAAEDALPLVGVEVERLPPVVDVESAMHPDSPQARLTKLVDETTGDEGVDAKTAHAAVGGTGAELEVEDLSPNVINRKRYAGGDTLAAFATADATVTGRFRTNWVYQAYIEPHTATAWIDPDGSLVVESSTQGTFYTRKQLARIYGLPLTRIRVKGAPLGGAFGSKVLVVDPLVAGAALILRRPVRLSLTRREDIAATNPAAASTIELRIGARADGAFVAVDARLVFDAGAYIEWSIEEIAAVLIAGPYRWPAFDIRAYGVRTNRFGTGSYRGPGAPQAAFAVESLVDELARELDLDPIELRLRNLVDAGDPMVDGDRWPGLGHAEVLTAIQRHPIWQARHDLPAGEGVGIGIGVWPGAKGPAAAICRLNGDGTITITTGVVDMSGTFSSFVLIAADSFGVPPEAVDVVALDTAGAPVSPLSGGSIVTYTAGLAIRDAAREARRQLLEYAALQFEIDPDDLEIVGGMIRPIGSPDRGRPVAAFAEELSDFGSPHPAVEGHASTVQKSLAPSCAAHLVHVRVDRETGIVALVGHAIAQDVGRALNPALVEGQMRGGAAQGIGWALYEQLIHDSEGQLVTGSLLDYVVPRATDIPDIDTLIVEVPAPDGPFGAKGIGEASVIAVGGAIANAIVAAGGPRMRELPMTPRRVWEAWQGQATGS